MSTFYEQYIKRVGEINYSKVKDIPAKVRSMYEILKFMSPGVKAPKDDAVKIYIVTNSGNIRFGAHQILKPEVQEEVSEILGGDFFILPSSIHEVLCLPYDEERIEEIKQMVKTINATEVSATDFLSDDVFVYRNGEISAA